MPIDRETHIPPATHSEESADIFGRQPAWIIRWGITVLCLIVVGLAVGCYCIQYPQTVDAVAVITTLNPPSDLVIRTDGRIDTIYVSDKQTVHKGDRIALLNDVANAADIDSVIGCLAQSYQQSTEEMTGSQWLSQEYNLGNIQQTYETFRLLCADYRHYLTTDHIGKQKELLQQQIEKNRHYCRKIAEQQRLLSRDLEYEYRSVSRDSALYAEGVISLSDYEAAIRNTLQTEKNKATMDAGRTAAELELMQLEQRLIELDLQRDNETANYERQLRQQRRQLMSALEQWKYQYVVESPIDGTITFINYWSKNQWVTTGERIASVIAQDSMEVAGRMNVPSANFGEVETGQAVYVRLNSYPYLRFGMLRGVVRNISAIPDVQTGTYIVEVAFPDGLTTTYHKPIAMIQRMDGTGKIVTKERRLTGVFVEPIRALFEEVK